MSACLDEDVSCVTDSYDTVRVNFLKLDQSNARTDTLYFESIQAANGAFLDVQDTALSSISLPLNPSGNQVSFFINWREDSAAVLQTDTLVISYEREQRLISPECGVEQRFVSLSSSKVAFDSIRVANPDVTLYTNPNLSIYTCQYEYTNVVRARFFVRDTATLAEQATSLQINSIVDDQGNVIQNTPATLERVSLPVDTDRSNTSFMFEIENADGQIVNRRLNVSYFVDEIQIFNCFPQTRVSGLDVDSDDYDFVDVEVDDDELKTNNSSNLEIFF
ncbi:DUF6452 family protein [Porifericola rhodea]|uniref:DUF6452 family protein n=1 Tax=Porifericola rhodea TaxID=930972 RepID=UPI002665C4B4|nr:DUF6452 family protein [Porifericola rhodea]WKN33269.1 DUF6452 family protein [Porifericola rhodea]